MRALVHTQIRSPWGPDPGPAEHLPLLQSTLPPGTRGRQRRGAELPRATGPLGPGRPRGRRGEGRLWASLVLGRGPRVGSPGVRRGPQPGSAHRREAPGP